jgi:hypothetical protein
MRSMVARRERLPSRRFCVTLIALKAYASLRELVHGFLNIVDREIENSEGRRSMIRLTIVPFVCSKSL